MYWVLIIIIWGFKSGGPVTVGPYHTQQECWKTEQSVKLHDFGGAVYTDCVPISKTDPESHFKAR